MSFLSTIGHGIKAAVTGIADAFKDVFGAKGDQAVKDFAAAELEMLKTEAGQVALKVVEDLAAQTDLTSTQKWEQAGTEMLAQLAAAGITATKSTVNLLIELAYNVVSGKVTVTATPAAADAGADG